MCILMRTCASVICVALVALMWATSCEAGEGPDMTGAALYQEFCATCHGVSGHGDGPVALSLKRRVPDLDRWAIDATVTRYFRHARLGVGFLWIRR